ncbi:DUF4845 domain-containing protein [Thiothrix litoralis]|jgi:hypothetical protein|uniref:DUF4845 domain-containing protein n=1 Tax=Thiothrix litoralis TaxID=2891210 RepID=A0ABX7WYH6_9GAMM|nr:DUF4845 domain-containing protein [Thiothrix litoralis]QTR48222.1 DUF4845 domain-containing protein [Thiothrix litoralis]
MRKQQGATFLTWVAGLGVVIFAFITVVKIAPVYLEFQTVRSIVDRVVQEASAKASTQEIRRKVDDFIIVNSLNTLSVNDFNVVQVEGKNNVRALEIHYEVRKHWVANIDFLMTFQYSKELGAASDT